MQSIQILITLFLILAVNALAIIGFHYATMFQRVTNENNPSEKVMLEGSKNLLWKIRFYGEIYLSQFWQKPLYSCMRCMASVHGLYIYIPLIPAIFPMETWIYFVCYPVYALALSGLMILIESKFNV